MSIPPRVSSPKNYAPQFYQRALRFACEIDGYSKLSKVLESGLLLTGFGEFAAPLSEVRSGLYSLRSIKKFNSALKGAPVSMGSDKTGMALDATTRLILAGMGVMYGMRALQFANKVGVIDLSKHAGTLAEAQYWTGTVIGAVGVPSSIVSLVRLRTWSVEGSKEGQQGQPGELHRGKAYDKAFRVMVWTFGQAFLEFTFSQSNRFGIQLPYNHLFPHVAGVCSLMKSWVGTEEVEKFSWGDL